MKYKIVNKALIVITDEELKQTHVYNRLTLVLRNMGFASRHWLDELGSLLVDIELYDLEVKWPDGKTFEIPFIDDLISDDCRSLRNIMAVDETRCNPRFRSRQYDLLRLLFLYINWEYPKIAKLVRK